MRIPCNFEQCSISTITDSRYKRWVSPRLNAGRLSGLQSSSGWSLQDFPRTRTKASLPPARCNRPLRCWAIHNCGTQQLPPVQPRSTATHSTSSSFAYSIPIQLNWNSKFLQQRHMKQLLDLEINLGFLKMMQLHQTFIFELLFCISFSETPTNTFKHFSRGF